MSYYCSVCNDQISDKMYAYSMDHFGRAICMECLQKNSDGRGPAPVAKATPQAVKLSYALTKRGIRNNLVTHDAIRHVDISIPWARLFIELDFQQQVFDEKQLHADLEREVYDQEDISTVKVPNALVDQNVDAVADSLAKFAVRRYRQDKEEKDYEDEEEDDLDL